MATMSPVRCVFVYLCVISAVLLFVAGGLSLWAYSYTSNMVRTELATQKIYFPEKGDPSFDPTIYPDLQQYAGQLVDSPEKARAYANGFIGRHLAKVANGKVYAEVSAEAKKDPNNQALQQQKQTLFQGETLRGMLLSNGYGFGTMGKIAGYAAIFACVGGLLLLVIAIVLRIKA